MLELVLLLFIGLKLNMGIIYWIILGISVILKSVAFIINVIVKVIDKTNKTII